MILRKCKCAYTHLNTFPDFCHDIPSFLFLVKVASISGYTWLPSGKMEITFLQTSHMKIEVALRKDSHHLPDGRLELKPGCSQRNWLHSGLFV